MPLYLHGLPRNEVGGLHFDQDWQYVTPATSSCCQHATVQLLKKSGLGIDGKVLPHVYPELMELAGYHTCARSVHADYDNRGI
jgi:hypothetical protein